MHDSPHLRFATPADIPALVAMIRELAEFEKLLDRCRSTEASLSEALFRERPQLEALVAEVAGEVVAMALFYPTYSTFRAAPGLHLHDLYVKPAHRNRGIGTALLRRLANVAFERGATRVDWTVLDWNEAALDRYRKLGAEIANGWLLMGVEGPALERLAKHRG